MYELVLDGSTIMIWSKAFLIVVVIFSTSLVGLWFTSIKKKIRLLAFPAGLLFISSVVALFHITLSPFSYHRKLIEPSIVLGEKVFRCYSDYKKEHGQYPPSISEVYFTELDYFDVIAGVRQSPKCDGFGGGCKGLTVRIDKELVVEVHHELIQCDITNLVRHWKCRDHR